MGHGKSLVLSDTVKPLPISVDLDSERVDGFMARALVVSAGGTSISSGISSSWRVPLVKNVTAAVFNLGRLTDVVGELRMYPIGELAQSGWEATIAERLQAIKLDPKYDGVRFEFNEDGSIQFLLPTESRGREVRNARNQIVFSDKREVYPTLWGERYYIVKYDVTEGLGTDSELNMTVSELFLSAKSVDIHIVFRASTKFHADLYKSFFSYLKQFYILADS